MHNSLGQGGLSDDPMWNERIPEIRAVKPRLIRLFVQDYFGLLPQRGHYHFESLDRSVDTILAADSKPLMCLCFKPRLLFPEINQDIVEPNDEAAWEELVYSLVRHNQERGAGIRYWEVANEPDIGEDGGCPYRFTAENYPRYYQHTVAAILRADPQARVGGPALAGWNSPILPALLEFCSAHRTPLHFVSWHAYTSDPNAIRNTIEGVRTLLQRFPTLKPETFLDEWNMNLTDPPLDPRFQPCYTAEVIWQMKEAGLDYSCYYHIRDWHVSFDQFATIMSGHGTAFMSRWWNRMPQFDGLFDFQNHARPAYFTFKLLSRLRSQRLRVSSTNPAVHGFATYDEQLLMYNLVLWNFSQSGVELDLRLQDLPKRLRARHIVLDAISGSDDENVRLRPEPFFDLNQGNGTLRVSLEPYAVHYWSCE
ncbi:MAG: GH39 family glycosyl hydrolase [Limisphaerales bacterium]